MSACLRLLLPLWSLQAAVAARLAPPQDVSMLTLNTNYTLTWTWNSTESVSFTTQYIPHFKYQQNFVSEDSWSPVCEDSRRSCDLTELDLYYLGVFVLRVRATVNGSHSEWVERKFCPERNAALGPPSSVHVSPSGSNLDLIISAPLSSKNTSMKENLSDLYYHIQYWEHHSPQQFNSVDSPADRMTLSGLRSWTRYCVRVQSRGDYYNKNSSFTVPLCTSTQGPLPWWQIFLFFVASLLLFFLIMFGLLLFFFCCCRTLKATLRPSIQLPKYLCDSPGSDVPRLLTPDSQSELQCEKVTICPEPPVLQVHPPPADALQEPDVRHSRQDSSGSDDSGVYSSGGSSSIRPGPPLTGEGGGASSHNSFLLDLVKMKDMTERSLVITDDCVVDLSV